MSSPTREGKGKTRFGLAPGALASEGPAARRALGQERLVNLSVKTAKALGPDRR